MIDLEDFITYLLTKEKFSAKRAYTAVAITEAVITEINYKSKLAVNLNISVKYITNAKVKFITRNIVYPMPYKLNQTREEFARMPTEKVTAFIMGNNRKLETLNDINKTLNFDIGVKLELGIKKDEFLTTDNVPLDLQLKYCKSTNQFVSVYYVNVLQLAGNMDRFHKLSQKFTKSALEIRDKDKRFIYNHQNIPKLLLSEPTQTVIATPMMLFVAKENKNTGKVKMQLVYDLRKHSLREAKGSLAKAGIKSHDIFKKLLNDLDLRKG